MSVKNHLVTGQLENISWQVLEQYRDIIKEMIKGKSGIYALYNRDKLYYVGLASNLKVRLNQHLKDRHGRKWDRFSVYLTRKDEHMKELESLFLRIFKPPGNKVVGKFGGSVNMRSELLQEIRNEDLDRRAKLLGGRTARSRIRTKAKHARGKDGLKGLLNKRMTLKGWRDGYEYTASARKDGTIRYGDKIFDTPNASARAATGKKIRGWQFWHYRNKSGEWVQLVNLKKGI